ncbi:MAG: DUF4269 domain-containing protein [Symploca sp. SIO1B1]|nr:DUF4269 domain-containing protein [Symploca sp. SIO1C2]NER99208.1 DUF4269 domain-containing protein [Symploca sp. SIO1B1]
MRLEVEQVVQNLSLLVILCEFDPVVIGTPPLGLELETSDIDIACSAKDLARFQKVTSTELSKFDCFQCRHATWQNQKSVIVQFHAYDWDIELFCQTIPTNQQWGVRHFKIEQRLLNIEPKLRGVVLRLKQMGLKTEPAFVHALGLPGDPYSSILELENLSNDELAHLIARCSNRL